MEISRKSNFRFKALVIGLLATIIASVCGPTVYGLSLLNLKPDDEPFLNRTVTFTGPTHWRSDGQGRKISLFRKGEELAIKDNGTYEGVITLIDPNNTYKYYVLGKGWISDEQIQTARRFLTIEINPIKGNEYGLNGFIKVDGEYLDIVSDNDAVVSVDKDAKTITARAAGSTTVKIKQKDGTVNEVLAVVVGQEGKQGGLSLTFKIDEANMAADLSASLDSATLDVWNKTVKLNASGNADAVLSIKDGKLSLDAKGDGQANIQVKGKDGEYKEVVKIEADGTMKAVVDPREMVATVEAQGTEKLTILEKLTIALKESGKATASKEGASVTGGAGADVIKDGQTTNIGEVTGTLSYKTGDTDPTGSIEGKIFGKEFSTGQKNIPIVSGLKALIGKIR